MTMQCVQGVHSFFPFMVGLVEFFLCKFKPRMIHILTTSLTHFSSIKLKDRNRTTIFVP